jgi:hypothetical protein
LVEFAKEENRQHAAAKAEKELAAEMERRAAEEAQKAALLAAADSLPGAAPGASPGTQPHINFHAVAKANLDMCIELHIVEDGMILGLPQKPAFREMIDAAVEYGAQTKGKVPYIPPGKKRVRDDLLIKIVKKLKDDLSSYDEYIQEFGASLVSDGKNDVCGNHLTDYVTVTPNGYRFEGTKDVSGISRKA